MAHVWDGIKKRLKRTSKKDVYVILSLTLLAFLAITIIYDLSHLWGTENTDKTTQKFTMALLLIHTLGFYFGLLGFIYITQASGYSAWMVKPAMLAIAGNTLAFIVRITIEVGCSRYREEIYRTAAEAGK